MGKYPNHTKPKLTQLQNPYDINNSAGTPQQWIIKTRLDKTIQQQCKTCEKGSPADNKHNAKHKNTTILKDALFLLKSFQETNPNINKYNSLCGGGKAGMSITTTIIIKIVLHIATILNTIINKHTNINTTRNNIAGPHPITQTKEKRSKRQQHAKTAKTKKTTIP